MKKTLLLSLFASLALVSSAQISLKKEDIPAVGKNYLLFNVVDSATWRLADTLDLGKAGPNGVYDFKNMMNIGYDSTQRFLGSVDLIKFKHPHKSANVVELSDVSVNRYRDPITFTIADFANKTTKYAVMNVAANDSNYGNLAAWSYFGSQGLGQPFYFDMIDNFPSTPSESVYIDPASTKWAADFKTAVAAKLLESKTDGSGNTITEFYAFYEINGNDFVVAGIGAKVDKGMLASGTPNGNFVYTHTKVKPPYRAHTTDFTMGATLRDSTFWRLQVKEGLTELRHFDHLKTVRKVNAAGVLHLSHDSFEVIQIRKLQFHAVYDSVMFSGSLNQLLVDTSTRYYYEYYTKAYGEPILSVETNFQGDSIISARYLNEMNITSFSTLKTDTILKAYNFYNSSDKAFSLVGMSAILDLGMITGQGTTGEMDTLHVIYSSPQTQISTDMVYGFNKPEVAKYSIKYPLGDFTELKMDVVETNTVEVDGYGTLYLRDDTAQVLRIVTVNEMINTQTIYIGGFPVNKYTDTSYIFRYEFWGQKAGMPLVKIEYPYQTLDYVSNCTFMDVPNLKNAVPNKKEMKKPTIFPNPAHGVFTLSSPNMDNYQVQMLDINGRILMTKTFNQSLQIQVENWEKGIYLLRISNQNNGETSMEKIIVE